MSTSLKAFAVAAVVAAGFSGAVMAQPACGPGYGYYDGACRPVPAPGYPSNPVSGAAAGAASGAAAGDATAGPVGAVVGGAVGTATGTVAGTANMLTGGSVPPRRPALVQGRCAPGRVEFHDGCYPPR